MNRPSLLAVLLSASALIPLQGVSQTWTEDSFDDFADGTLDASGQNIYVSRDGQVRTIHRFDLNEDGWIDLLFNGTHDLIGILPATAGSVDIGHTLQQQPLSVEGSLAVAAADLNKDGWTDLVFCPNRQGVQDPRRFVTILYGGPDGWPASRSNGVLPTYDAVGVAVVDLDRDSWPDIAVLNGSAWLTGQPEGRVIRVYRGGEHGFILRDFVDLGSPSAVALVSGDVDADGAADLAVLRADNVIQVFWSQPTSTGSSHESTTVAVPGADMKNIAAGDCSADSRTDLVVATNSDTAFLLLNNGGRALATPEPVTAFPANHAAIGDVDNDGQADIVLTHSAIAYAAGGEAIGTDKNERGSVHVLWGDKGKCTRERATTIAVPYATAAAAADLDGDGRTDLAVARYQDEMATFTTKSLLVFGDGTRALSNRIDGPEVTGATDTLAVPTEGSLPARMVFCNSQGGHVDERVQLRLYWGAREGFSSKRMLEVPFNSGYEATAADLNADGHVDLVELCSGHAGGSTAEAMTQLGANVYWGKPGGIDPAVTPTVLREYNLYSSNTADLDKDGYLDLVLGAFAPPPQADADLLVIYYGATNGFPLQRRVALASPGRSSICSLADLNSDGWLDIAVTSYDKDRTRIFWGGAQGFDAARQQELAVPAPIELETADLNADGCLDLLVGSYEDSVAKHHDTGIFLFWGSADGFHEWNAQWLPGATPLGLTVADWDADGYLDVFAASYHGELTREKLPSYLYWGGPDGFQPRARTVFIGDSPSDALAADFDKDGRLDLALSCHTVDGNHACDSKVFYNDGQRFAQPRIANLPTVGPHWMWTEDMGHIFHRRWQQTYTSSVFTWEPSANTGRLECAADVPEGTNLTFEIRSSGDTTSMLRQPWQKVENGALLLGPTDRALQYRATFISDNGDRFPTLDKVTISLVR